LEVAAKQVKVQEVVPQSQNKINYERKKQIDAKLRKVDKEIQRLESAIEKLEAELAEQDTIMANPDQHPDIKIDNDWYWAYGKKKEELQTLLDDWSEKQIEREEVMAEYDK
jgi:ATP-binding cassette subfamily F protein 3